MLSAGGGRAVQFGFLSSPAVAGEKSGPVAGCGVTLFLCNEHIL